MTYSDKLKDPRWQKKRLEIMQRDGWKCRDCSASDKQLQVHHCVYEKHPWEVKSEYLMTVCEDCHQLRQKLEDGARMMIGEIASNLTPSELSEHLEKMAWDVAWSQTQRRANA